jgi:hypothetical protein
MARTTPILPILGMTAAIAIQSLLQLIMARIALNMHNMCTGPMYKFVQAQMITAIIHFGIMGLCIILALLAYVTKPLQCIMVNWNILLILLLGVPVNLGLAVWGAVLVAHKECRWGFYWISGVTFVCVNLLFTVALLSLVIRVLFVFNSDRISNSKRSKDIEAVMR